MVYCIFTAGASAKMGLRSVEAVRPLLAKGQRQAMTRALVAAGAHRFPNARPAYVVTTRNYLQSSFSMRLRERLNNCEWSLRTRAGRWEIDVRHSQLFAKFILNAPA